MYRGYAISCEAILVLDLVAEPIAVPGPDPTDCEAIDEQLARGKVAMLIVEGAGVEARLGRALGERAMQLSSKLSMLARARTFSLCLS